MAAPFNQTRCCFVAILFLLVASAVGFPSEEASTLKDIMVASRSKTSSPTPANPVETPTGTVAQTESEVYPAADITIQPSPDVNRMTEREKEEQDKQLNVSRSEDSKSSLTITDTPKYEEQQHNVSPLRSESKGSESGKTQRNLNLETSTPVRSLDKETKKSIGTEREEDETFYVEDLLTPIPRSVIVLTNMMKYSMLNLDTAFRGTVKNQSPVVQYGHSFHTTLLQISQKLSNAFLISRTNADKIKMHSRFVPSKVKEATGYLEKFKNSSRMVEFLYLSLKNLKETTDQTFNLSNQISSQFGELFQLADAVTESHNSSKLNKEQNKMNVTAELKTKNEKKKEMEREILFIENYIAHLKLQKKSDETAFNDALEDLMHLQNREAEESGCSFRKNSKTGKNDWYCPNKPESSKNREGNEKALKAQKNLEKTMKSLSAKEDEAAKKREVDNELKITIEKLRHEMHQLNEDVQLLEKTSNPINRLKKNVSEVNEIWKKFVTICEYIQIGATKSLDIIEKANRTSTHWSKKLSDEISLNLNKTKENFSLIETIIDIYLEGSSEDIVDIVAEIEKMMTKRDNPKELEKSLKRKCVTAIDKIKKLTGRNEGQIKTRTSQQIQKGN